MKRLLSKIASGEAVVGVVGLGYVGLPLAVAFGQRFETVGYDRKERRLEELRQGRDTTLETSSEELRQATRLQFTGEAADLARCDVIVIAVPTPVDRYNRPDLEPLFSASRAVGGAMRPGTVVVYESTVYPGCTEEDCVPVLAAASGLVYNRDFFCGYSPERINPGDKEHTLKKIVKITSGSTPEAAEVVDALYQAILENGTHRASNIKVAEAAKVIENSQRDLNIAFVNELSKIFHLLGIDTGEVLAAAGTKWNFLPFRPGLVGGHCIGVDPYYLTHKAQALGYLPEVILAGRRINDGMGRYVASEVVKLMIHRGCRILGARVLQLGLTFKENCPDIRNSRAVDVVKGLEEFGCQVSVLEPLAEPAEVQSVYGLTSCRQVSELPEGRFDAIVLAVAHREFVPMDMSPLRHERTVVFDIKGVLPREQVDARL